MLRLRFKQTVQIAEPGFQGIEKLAASVIAILETVQRLLLVRYELIQALDLFLLLRREHVTVIDQALELLSKVITNLLVYYFYQLVRETDRAYIALLHWVSLLCSFV